MQNLMALVISVNSCLNLLQFKEKGEWGKTARQLGPLMTVLKPSELTSLSFKDLALGCNETSELDMQATDIQVRQ